MASKPMTKTQLVAALADRHGHRQEIRWRGTGRCTGLITDEVSGGGAVTLPGVGKSIAASVRSAWCVTPPRASRSTKMPTRSSK